MANTLEIEIEILSMKISNSKDQLMIVKLSTRVEFLPPLVDMLRCWQRKFVTLEL